MGCAQYLLGTAHVDMANDKMCRRFPLIRARQHGTTHSLPRGEKGGGGAAEGPGLTMPLTSLDT